MMINKAAPDDCECERGGYSSRDSRMIEAIGSEGSEQAMVSPVCLLLGE